MPIRSLVKYQLSFIIWRSILIGMLLETLTLLDKFNSTYLRLHKKYEDLFWVVRMGDYSQVDSMNEAERERDAFRSDPNNLARTKDLLATPDLSSEDKKRLMIWKEFFGLYYEPKELAPLKERITKLQSKIEQTLATYNEGYADPKTGQFVPASKMKIRTMMRTSPDEEIRKACHMATEKMAVIALDDYVKVVGLRNEYARALGFEDFYDYRLKVSEDMTKDQVFDLFDKIYESTKETFVKIRELEKTIPGLRKPWNFSYKMSGQFTAEEDPYYSFDDALIRWGNSFAALGMDFRGGTLQLDLLDRTGKYNNGFCHYPELVNFIDGKRNPGSANFTCNVVYGQIGSGAEGMRTLFHEGGHAADRLSSEQTETCLNTEWPPASVAWAETHSQFIETMLGSIEWRSRYAKDKDGRSYPFDLFERKIRKLRILAPHNIHGIMLVSNFERAVYETKDLTADKVIRIAKEMERKYSDMSEDSLDVLITPHIYSWDSSAYYHAYGLARLGLSQWRKYFYDKYGYIVDNPQVGKEMNDIWALGSLKKFGEFIKLATGKEISPEDFLEEVNMSAEDYLSQAKERVARMNAVPQHSGPIELNALIKMVHGRETVADNSKSFEDMAEKYAAWLQAF